MHKNSERAFTLAQRILYLSLIAYNILLSGLQHGWPALRTILSLSHGGWPSIFRAHYRSPKDISSRLYLHQQTATVCRHRISWLPDSVACTVAVCQSTSSCHTRSFRHWRRVTKYYVVNSRLPSNRWHPSCTKDCWSMTGKIIDWRDDCRFFRRDLSISLSRSELLRVRWSQLCTFTSAVLIV